MICTVVMFSSSMTSYGGGRVTLNGLACKNMLSYATACRKWGCFRNQCIASRKNVEQRQCQSDVVIKAGNGGNWAAMGIKE